MIHIEKEIVKFDCKRCSQCGVCVGVCPQSAICFNFSDREGIYIGEINREKCNLCGLCVTVCPSHYLCNDLIDETVLKKAEKIFLGYSKDEDMRFNSSTGGVARTLIKTLLSEGIVDAAYTLYNDSGDFGDVCGEFIEKDQFSPKNIPYSLYKPVLWGKNLNRKNLKKSWKNILLVGLPCQIKAAKKYFNKVAPHLDFITIALLCRQNKSIVYSKYIKYAKNLNDEKRIVYKGNGWPSFTTMDKLVSFGWNFWKLGGCYYCIDCLAANDADVTLADPWKLIHPKEDNCGTNVIFCWNKKAVTLLKNDNSGVEVTKEVGIEDFLPAFEYDLIKYKKKELDLLLGKDVSMVTRVHFFFKEAVDSFYKKILFTQIIKFRMARKFLFGIYFRISRYWYSIFSPYWKL